ncbi:MAG: diguanylate cyclase [Cyanobacteria bacterium J06638_28]
MVPNPYQAFFVQSTVGMGCLDLSGYLCDVNPAFCHLMGYAATELLGTRFHQWIHPEDVQTYQEAYAELIAGNVSACEVEQRLLKRTSNSHWVLTRFFKLFDDPSAEKALFAATLEDINDRKCLEIDLRRQIDREHLLADFAQRMQQSLDLEQILQFSVEAVHQHLSVDRVVVYRLDAELAQGTWSTRSDHTLTQNRVGGIVIVESVSADCTPMLHRRIEDPCFCLDACIQPYREGKVSAVSNIYTMGWADCYVAMLALYEVTANLIIPIRQDGELWGLLVIHQCHSERTWQAEEISLLQQLVVQMAIAIKQSELYHQGQQEAKHQQAINALSQSILGTQNLESFFALALAKILDVLEAEQVVVGQYRAANRCWLLIAEAKIDSQIPTKLGEERSTSPEQIWAEGPTVPLTMNGSVPTSTGGMPSITTLFPQPWILCPLVLNSGIWGGLMVSREATSANSWTAQELNLIQGASQQLALAVQQNLFFRRWQRQAQQQAGITRLVEAIRESLELPQIFKRAAEEVRELLQVERVLILEFDAHQRLWVVLIDAGSGQSPTNFVGLEIPDEPNSLTRLLKQGQVLSFNASQPYPEEMLQILAQTFVGGWLLVPIKVNQRTWGALHCIQKDPWQSWQQEIAISVSDHLAIAIQHSRLYQQVKAANRRLKELALLDGLTQIPNRRYFDEHLRQEWRRAQREAQYISLILCDVDFFKRYNDTYGHQQGDECLLAIAQMLKSTVQRSGDIVARYGGEEFGIILPQTTSIGAASVAKEIQAALEALAIPHTASDISDAVTMSLGIACLYPWDSLTANYLVQLADQSLYEAKGQGRNQFCIYPKPTEDSYVDTAGIELES